MLRDVCYRNDTGQVIITKAPGSFWTPLERGVSLISDNLKLLVITLDLTNEQATSIPNDGDIELLDSIAWKVNAIESPTILLRV